MILLATLLLEVNVNILNNWLNNVGKKWMTETKSIAWDA